jgi:polyisoprenoid-binding protein YceI
MLRALALSLALLAPPALADTITPVAVDAPPGTYQIDPQHTRIMFSVSHMGFSNYTAFFTGFDAKLQFDPANPQSITVDATVKPGSVETLFPDTSVDFNGIIAGSDLLDAAAYPEARFVSTAVTLTGPNTATVTGDLTLHGVTRPMTWDVTFNGGYPGMELDVGARIGFSATGHIKRSDYGMAFGLPEPGSTLGVFDEVTLRIETEFVKPRDGSAAQP